MVTLAAAVTSSFRGKAVHFGSPNTYDALEMGPCGHWGEDVRAIAWCCETERKAANTPTLSRTLIV